jgi:hypothetical protein
MPHAKGPPKPFEELGIIEVRRVNCPLKFLTFFAKSGNGSNIFFFGIIPFENFSNSVD